MKLTDEEQALLDRLAAKADAPDAPDDLVEIFSGDKGARIPASQAKAWLAREFGIGDGDAGDAGDAGDQAGAPAGKKTAKKPGGDGKPAAAPAPGAGRRYFGKD